MQDKNVGINKTEKAVLGILITVREKNLIPQNKKMLNLGNRECVIITKVYGLLMLLNG